MITTSGNLDANALREPFSPEYVQWRVGQAGLTKAGKPWAKVLAYIDSRAIMDRLDEVVGPANWRDEYQAGPAGGVICGLSLRIDGEWVTKWDGAENTDIEAIKGGISDSLKRAAVKWGIGRYLYDLGETFANISDRGEKYSHSKVKVNGKDEYVNFNWDPPQLPAWALPKKVEAPKERITSVAPRAEEPAPPPKAEGGGKVATPAEPPAEATIPVVDKCPTKKPTKKEEPPRLTEADTNYLAEFVIHLDNASDDLLGGLEETARTKPMPLRDELLGKLHLHRIGKINDLETLKEYAVKKIKKESDRVRYMCRAMYEAKSKLFETAK